MKRLLPFLLALCCLFSCLHAASAEYDAFFTTPDQAVNDRGEHFCYKLKDGAAVLTDYWVEDTARQPAVIEIPAILNGHPVTAIGPYAFDAGFYQSPDELRIRYDTQSVERIIVPEGVTELQPHRPSVCPLPWPGSRLVPVLRVRALKSTFQMGMRITAWKTAS